MTHISWHSSTSNVLGSGLFLARQFSTILSVSLLSIILSVCSLYHLSHWSFLTRTLIWWSAFISSQCCRRVNCIVVYLVIASVNILLSNVYVLSGYCKSIYSAISFGLHSTIFQFCNVSFIVLVSYEEVCLLARGLLRGK